VSRKFTPLKLRTHILILVVLAGLPLAGLVWHRSRIDLENKIAKQQEDSRLLGRYEANSVSQLIYGVRQLLLTLATADVVRQMDSAGATRLFGEVLAKCPECANIGLVTGDGKILASALPFPENLNMSDRPWFRELQRTRDFAIGEYRIGRISKTEGFDCALALPEQPAGRPVASIFVGMRASAFQACIDISNHRTWNGDAKHQLATAAELPAGGASALVDRNGTILARIPNPEQHVGKLVSTWPGVEKAQGSPTVEGPGADGVIRVFHYIPVPGTDNSLFINFGQPKAILQASSRVMFTGMLWEVGIVAIAALFTAFLVAEISILRPVQKLITTAGQLASGNRGARLESGLGRGELSKLASVFNSMADALDKQHCDLEQQISNRTKELADANSALRTSERTTRTLLDTLPGCAILLDEDGMIIDHNDALSRHFGHADEFLAGHSLFTLLPSELAPIYRERLEQTRLAGQVLRYNEQHDGNSSMVLIHPVASPEGHKQRVSFALLIIEMTEQNQLADKLRQTQKMEALGQLAGGVAHDFNNILAAMLLNIGLLKKDPNLADETRSGLQEVQDAANRAASLTRQMLLFSRQQIMQPERIEFNQALRQLAPMLRRLLNEKIQIVFSYCAEDIWLDADPTMLDQVVLNLCVNARDAMPNGGLISVTTTLVTRNGSDPDSGRSDTITRLLELCISDSGAGMSDIVKGHLFEPFFTTKEVGKGTGLGLSAVHGIVKQHAGWVIVESTLGKGTEFKVYIPALPAASPLPQEPGEESTPTGHEAILLVEDDESVRTYTARALSELGYEVLEAADPAMARRQWKEHSQRIDLLFTDMVIPGIRSGLELALEFRVDRPDLHVLIGSGYSGGISSEPSAEHNINYIPKPYNISSLARALRKSIDRAAPESRTNNSRCK
jgi:PAS domain S-box-containing protein